MTQSTQKRGLGLLSKCLAGQWTGHNGEVTAKLIALCAYSIKARGQFGTQNTPETIVSANSKPAHVTRHCARPVRRPLRVEYHTSRATHRPCAVASGWAGEGGNDICNEPSYYGLDSSSRSIYIEQALKTLIYEAANQDDWRVEA
jgi:hypothetical protein